MAENRKSISELTELPGNLNPDAILAIVQGGVTYHTDFAKLLAFIAGNMATLALPAETYTPELTAATTAPTVSYASRGGQYIRLGNLVWFAARVNIATISGGSGQLRLTLPLAASSVGSLNPQSVLMRGSGDQRVLLGILLGENMLIETNTSALLPSAVGPGSVLAASGVYLAAA